MKTEECVLDVGAERLAATRFDAETGHPPSVISFHGTGTGANRARIRYVLEYLAVHGVSSACFDFSGHGESSGKLEHSSLRLREQQGHAAAKLLCPDLCAIIGTSMGAHVAAVLSPVLKPRSLILFCPAAYPEAAATLPLNERFSSVAHRPGAYLDSPAFAALQHFRGNLVIAAARGDAVIPPEVVDLYLESAPFARSKVIWLEGAGHQAHAWLQEHEKERAAVLREILAVVQP